MTYTVAGTPQVPFQLLEINIISAQDLAPVSRKMRTYAIAWIHPDRKLSTRVDTTNKSNPTWNDKFVFRVDDAFLRSDTSAVMIEIYAISFFRDQRVGNVRVLVSNLIPPASRTQTPGRSGMRFVALQVRRKSGRPQGILNLGVALLDGSMRSMPIYTQLTSSAVGYRDLMGEEAHSPHHHHNAAATTTTTSNTKNNKLRRSRSERHSNVTDADYPRKSGITGSEFGEPPLATITTGSMWSESDVGHAASIAAGMAPEELYEKNHNINTHTNNNGTIDILEKWGEKDKVEDLKSKLERWRTELPPVYDRGVVHGSYKQDGRHVRRHTDGGSGLFSCFGEFYGFECSIACGVKPKKGKHRKGKNLTFSEEDETISQSFIIP